MTKQQQTTKVKIEIGETLKFSRRNGEEFTGKLVKEYPYKGINYLQIQTDDGKKHLINPKKVSKI